MTTKTDKVCKWFYNHNNLFSCIGPVSVTILVIVLFFSSVIYVSYLDMGARRNAIQETLNTFRDDPKIHIVERAAAIQKVAGFNESLASAKYWNNNIWVGLAIPNKVASLEYIK